MLTSLREARKFTILCVIPVVFTLNSGTTADQSVQWCTFDFQCRTSLNRRILATATSAFSLWIPILKFRIPVGPREFQYYSGRYIYPDSCIRSCFKSRNSDDQSLKRPYRTQRVRTFQSASLFVDASANYYGGGALQGAEVEWRVQGGPTHYRPPGWNGYIFGSRSQSGADSLGEIELRDELDLQGRSRLELKFTDDLAPVPYLLRFEATVADFSQQSRTVTDIALVHPVDLYVGVKPSAYRGITQEPIALKLIASDVDGTPLSGYEIHVTASLPGSTQPARAGFAAVGRVQHPVSGGVRRRTRVL